MGQIEESAVARRQDVDWLISSLHSLSMDPNCYGPMTIAHLAEQAALELRRAHPIDYSSPPTAFEDQLTLGDTS